MPNRVTINLVLRKYIESLEARDMNEKTISNRLSKHISPKLHSKPKPVYKRQSAWRSERNNPISSETMSRSEARRSCILLGRTRRISTTQKRQ